MGVATTCRILLGWFLGHRHQRRDAPSTLRLCSQNSLCCFLCAVGCAAFRGMLCCSARPITCANLGGVLCRVCVLLQCPVRSVLGTPVRPPVATPGHFPIAPLLLWSLAVFRNAFGTATHPCSPTFAFCLRSLFAFGMTPFVFGWCFCMWCKTPHFRRFGSDCVLPRSCAPVSLCGDFCRCPSAHTQCAHDCDSSLCTLQAARSALVYRTVYPIVAVPLAEAFLRVWMFKTRVQWMLP